MAHLTATIYLKDLGTIKEIHLGVFCPSVQTFSSAIDCSQVSFILVRPNRRRDVDLGVERTALTVIAAKDGTCHTGALTCVIVVHMRLIDITWRENLRAIGSAEDVLYLDGGLLRHVDHRAAGNALFVAATIDSINLSANEVDDGGVLVERFLVSSNLLFCCRCGRYSRWV